MPSPYGSGRRCAVLGHPIGHSLSPALHHAAYAHLDLDWSYQRLDVEQHELAEFVAGLDPTWRGLSLTMPLKQTVIELGSCSSTVELVGAGNTLLLGEDSPAVHNTDVDGVVQAVTAAGIGAPQHVVVLGAGATARSVVVALARLGVARATMAARARAAELTSLGERLGLSCQARDLSAPIPGADLVISTLAAGAIDERGDELTAAAAFFDVVYQPWPTPLAAAAARGGLPVISGLDLLVHQARSQITLMTGSAVPIEVLMSAGRAALGGQHLA